MTIHEFTSEQKAFQRQWIKALESEEYKQGEGKLRWSNNDYCCLGVALVIRPIPEGSWEGWVLDDREYFSYKTIQSFGEYFSDTNLPDSVRKELGISNAMQHVAIHMNDTLHWDFRRIACIFRRYFHRPELSSEWLHQDDLKKILDIPFHAPIVVEPPLLKQSTAS